MCSRNCPLVPRETVAHDVHAVALGEADERVAGADVESSALGMDRPRLHAVFGREHIEVANEQLALARLEALGQLAADGGPHSKAMREGAAERRVRIGVRHRD
jgi:hypothetical protein